MAPLRRPGSPPPPRRPDGSDWFPVTITEEFDPTEDGKPAYGFDEVYNRPAGNTVATNNRRVGVLLQPGVPLGDATFAVGDYALARLCPGDGGRTWELMAGGDGGGSTPDPADPVPTVIPLTCPVDPPEPAECCLPDDPECCPEIFLYPFPSTTIDSGTGGVNRYYFSWYYYDCDQRQQFFTPDTDPGLFDRCVNKLVKIVCPPDPVTHEDRFYYDGECRTCDQIHAIDPEYSCTPPSVQGPVCVTLSGGTGVFSGLSATIPNLPVEVDLDVPFEYTDVARGITITGVLVYDPAGSPPGWYFSGTAHSTQAGSEPFGCGCRVVVTRGFFTGTGVTQTVTAGPVLGTPPSESLLLETVCGAFTIGLGACSPPPPPPPPPPPAECCNDPAEEGLEAEPLAGGPDLQFTSDLTGTITLAHSSPGGSSHWINGPWDLSCEQLGEWRMTGPGGIFSAPTSVFCARPNESNPAGVFVLTFAAADFPGSTTDPTVTLVP